MGPGMLTISHEHQGTVSAQETGPESRPDKVCVCVSECVCVDGNHN